ncbi:MAG: hypothetical protein IPN79_15155 [Saprospiraceae bacterium]|nr:hypothetical protein [Saprospiraceae bacterium]
MKNCKNFCLLLVICIIPFCLQANPFRDTVGIQYDTIFCAIQGDSVLFESSLDTADYNFLWVKLKEVSDTLSTSNGLWVNKNDTIIRYSFPRDTMDKYYIDTILIKIHFYPKINLEFDSIKCYTGMPIKIGTNTKLDTSYNKEIISFYDQMNQPLPNINFNKNANNYFVEIGNGDTVIVKFTYTTSGCLDNIVFSEIGTKFLPQIQLESDTVCFGDSTRIKNLSIFDPGLSSVNISIEGIGSNFTDKGNFKCFIDTNGETRKVFVTIDQQGCVQKDTFLIFNRKKPNANFNYNKTCENQFLVIHNNSTDTTPDFNIEFIIFSRIYNSINNSFTINDTMPDGVYSGLFRITNDNNCYDTISKAVVIDSVTYVWFTGLEQDYCVNQDFDTLIGSQNGGQFSGMFIDSVSPGIAIFRPTSIASNFEIRYSFTNGVQCIDSYSQEVENVYPKPDLKLLDLNDSYCEKEDPTLIFINQTIANNSDFTIFRDGIEIEKLTSITYLFDPFLPGNYIIHNVYTDNNGCISEITNSTIVSPLPMISLDSLQVLIPGSTITVGNNSPDDPDVSYLWSNGDTNSTTNLDQPGFYILYAFNTLTSCEVSDTIQIEYDKNITEELFQIQIFPNPTTDKINISLSTPKSNIKLIRLNGNTVSLNGTTSFFTDIFGKLILDVGNIPSGYYLLKIPEVGDFVVLKI